MLAAVAVSVLLGTGSTASGQNPIDERPLADGPGYYLPKQILQFDTTTTTETRRFVGVQPNEGDPCDAGAPAYPVVEPLPEPKPPAAPQKPGAATPPADPEVPQVKPQLGKVCIKEQVVTTRTVDAQLKLVPDIKSGFKRLHVARKALADVKISAEFREGGLLKSLNAGSQGRAGDLIIGIARIAGTVLGGGIPLFGQEGVAPLQTDCNPFFDPFKDQPDTLRLLLSRNASACKTWKALSAWSTHAQRLAGEVKANEEKLGGVNGGTELADLVTRLKELRKGADDAKKTVTALQATVTAMLDSFVASHAIGTKVEQTQSLDALELHELPGKDIAIANKASADLETELRDVAKLVAAADVLGRAGVVVRLIPLEGGTTPGGPAGDYRCTEEATDRIDIYFRQAQPVRLQVFAAQTPVVDGKPVLAKVSNQPLQTMKQMAERVDSVTFQTLKPRCMTFRASSFATRELVITFDERGQLGRIEHTAGSSAAAAVTALATAATTFRDEYATTVAKLVDIDTNQRKLKLSELTTQVETLKKERERIDAQLSTDVAAANFDLGLRQQRLNAEAATLQTQIALDTAQASLEQRKAIEQMKVEIEMVKRELELLKAKQDLAEAEK